MGLSKSAEFGGQGCRNCATAWKNVHASNLAFDLCPMLTQGAIEALELPAATR